MSSLKKFTFYWGDGAREVREAKSRGEALAQSPFCNQIHQPLIFLKDGDDNTYTWDDNNWVTTKLLEGDQHA